MAGGIPTSFQIGARVTPAAALSNYIAGTAAKGTKWATNYLQSKVDPFDAAAAASGRWLAELNAVGEAGFKAGIARVNKAQVATNVSKNGPAAYAAGTSSKSYKYGNAAQGLIPALQQIAANLPPRGTLSQNLARANQMATQAAALRGQFRG